MLNAMLKELLEMQHKLNNGHCEVLAFIRHVQPITDSFASICSCSQTIFAPKKEKNTYTV